MKSRLAILHFMPVEGYPPVQNLMQTLSGEAGLSIQCFTTKGNHSFETSISTSKIVRLGRSAGIGKWSKINLYSSYLLFNIWGLIKLLAYQPHSILYYETLSAFPALIYKRLFPKTKFLIHYHEYTTKEEYLIGPVISRWLHYMEQRNYKLAHSISHTNNERMKRFYTDNHLQPDSRFHILPNYPPLKWGQYKPGKKPTPPPYRMVYVGYTLENESMYMDEILWFLKTHPNFTLDCYLFKPAGVAKMDLKNLTNQLTFHEPLEYYKVPDILKAYHIGLILYRGSSENYIYNAPNKLFEYLACDLDVWYPDVMIGTSNYNNTATYPKVIPLDFKDLGKFNLELAVERTNLKYNSSTYFCEPVYQKLLDDL